MFSTARHCRVCTRGRVGEDRFRRCLHIQLFGLDYDIGHRSGSFVDPAADAFDFDTVAKLHGCYLCGFELQYGCQGKSLMSCAGIGSDLAFTLDVGDGEYHVGPQKVRNDACLLPGFNLFQVGQLDIGRLDRFLAGLVPWVKGSNSLPFLDGFVQVAGPVGDYTSLH